MPELDYASLVAWLRETYGDDLRWTASYDHATYQYTVQYIREDLKTELKSRELDTIIHRSMALFNREHVDDVYFHLGEARSLVVEHERATAVHVYTGEETGVVIKLRHGAEFSFPDFVDRVLAELGVPA
jgi:hypothetical protein